MPMTIGQVVKKLRSERGLSQYDVERMSEGKLNRDWLASLETGRSRSIRDPEKVEILAGILGTTVTDIYQRAGIVDVYGEIPDLPPDKQAILRDPDVAELTRIFASLSISSKRIALKLIHSLSENPQGEKKGDEQRE